MRMLPAEVLGAPSPERDYAELIALYTVLFPEDERARDEAIATGAARALGQFQHLPSELALAALQKRDPALLARIQERYGEPDGVARFLAECAKESLSAFAGNVFMPHGGFTAVAHARGVQKVAETSAQSLQELVFAGLILRTLYQIANHASEQIRGGASLNKAFFMLESADSGLITHPRSPSGMRKIWERFKNVAHMGAAILNLIQARNGRDEDMVFILNGMGDLYSVALSFQEFGLRKVSTHTKGSDTVLDAENLWRVPEAARLSDHPVAPPLALAQQTRLLAYRAPMAM